MALVHTVAEGKIQNTRYTRAHTHDTQISQKVLSLSSIMVIIDSRHLIDVDDDWRLRGAQGSN